MPYLPPLPTRMPQKRLLSFAHSFWTVVAKLHVDPPQKGSLKIHKQKSTSDFSKTLSRSVSWLIGKPRQHIYCICFFGYLILFLKRTSLGGKEEKSPPAGPAMIATGEQLHPLNGNLLISRQEVLEICRFIAKISKAMFWDLKRENMWNLKQQQGYRGIWSEKMRKKSNDFQTIEQMQRLAGAAGLWPLNFHNSHCRPNHHHHHHLHHFIIFIIIIQIPSTWSSISLATSCSFSFYHHLRHFFSSASLLSSPFPSLSSAS